MESCALALSSSYTLNPNPLKQIHRNGGCRPNTKTNPTWQQSYYSSPSVAAVQLLSLSTTTTAATSSSNYRTRYWNTSLLTFCSSSSLNSTCFLQQNQIHNGLRVVRAAASVSQSSGESAKPTELGRSLLLAAMFGVWYLLNIYFNIFNKQVLKIFPYPTTVTTFQFGCATLMILTIWGLNFHPRPKIYKSQIKPLVLLAVTHTIGNLLTNISLGKVAVSFTHTIKAMEPFFTVLFSTLLLAERPSPWVVLSLIPIVSGVASASFTEASFNWIGFSSAMASNITNQSRNVLSKQFMVRKEEALDNINLFSIITIASFVLLIPSMFLLEGIKFTPAQLQSAASQGVNVKELCVKLLLSGVCFHSYQQVSYMILQMVSPVTHSVGNCVKRVVVIVSSIIFFQTPVSPVSSLGTGLALAGVFLYSRAKQIKPKPKPKVA